MRFRIHTPITRFVTLVLLPIATVFFALFILNYDPFGWVWGFHGGLPEWSPDGTKIVYRCDQEDVYSGSVCVRRADRDERHMIRPWSGDYSGIHSVWSPDGKHILSSGFGVRVLNSDGTEEKTLDESGHSAVWSPDGTRIAYGLGSDLYVMNADGSGKRRLTTGNDPIWSPDGKRLLFGVEPDGNEYPVREQYSLFVISADSRDPVLRRNLGPGYDGVWSPDGRQIAFVAFGDRYNSLYLMNADGSHRQRLTPGTMDDNPRWSPKGDCLVYVRDGSDICLLYPDKGIIQYIGRGQDPAFSPDGKRIAFAYEGEGAGVSRIQVVVVKYPAR